jgi:hypothetical protein
MIKFYEQRQPTWLAKATDIGLSATQPVELATKIEKALGDQASAEEARVLAKNATEQAAMSAADLKSFGAGLMSTIRGFAESTGNNEVYTTALIPPPKPATPAGPPTSPTEIGADPHADGTITLKWKGTVANGQWFVIERSIDGGAWMYQHSQREKTWLDKAVPMNTNTIRYRVFGLRGTALSVNPPVATVNFGNLPAAIAAAFKSPTTAGAADAA